MSSRMRNRGAPFGSSTGASGTPNDGCFATVEPDARTPFSLDQVAASIYAAALPQHRIHGLTNS